MSHSADYSDREYPEDRDPSDYRDPRPLPRQPPDFSSYGYGAPPAPGGPRPGHGGHGGHGDHGPAGEAGEPDDRGPAEPGAAPDPLPSEAYSFPTLPPMPAYAPEAYQPPATGPVPPPAPPPRATPAPSVPPAAVQATPVTSPSDPSVPDPAAAAQGMYSNGPRHYVPGPQGPQQPQAPQPAPPPTAPSAAAPVAAPRPEDLLVPSESEELAEPATWGWRGRVHRATGGLVKPKASAEEIAVRKAIHDIQRGFSRPMTVVVVQPKGGAGKTPTTICLAAAFGAYRGGYVVGWDDNETRGTLAVRVSNPDDQRATVWDLLGDLDKFERFDARVGDLSYYVRPQPDAHFDALVSDDNPANMAQIGEDEFERLHTVLQRFYRLMVVDTGNNVRSPNWQAAVNAADLVVVVSTYQRDVGYSGSWVLDHLAQTGREELARNAVTVLTAADPTTDKTVRGQLITHFRARTRSVVEIPYDQEIAHGGPIRWTRLAPATRNAWIFAGATIVNALAEHDQRALAARRA